MQTLKEAVEEMLARQSESYAMLPDIDLYMDQVLSYLARWQTTLRGEERLTSSMINNYTKDGLVPRASGKKYSREHLVYLAAIMRLKQVLSVKDMAVLLGQEVAGAQAEAFFDRFNSLVGQTMRQVVQQQDGNEADLALSLAVNAYANKIACEFLIDRLARREEKTDKSKERKEQKEHGKSDKA